MCAWLPGGSSLRNQAFSTARFCHLQHGFQDAGLHQASGKRKNAAIFTCNYNYMLEQVEQALGADG